MKINQPSGFLTPLFLAFLLGCGTAAATETQSPLDAAQHPDSPQYQPAFDAAPLPLDTRLSWTRRFNGNETFNANEVLPQGSVMPTATAMSTDTAAMTMEPLAKPAMGMAMQMDGNGIIKGLRPEQGKVRISHGPIDKYGMPAMTMMFKVADPAQLQGLTKEQPVGFNVDNTSGGFILTHIMPMAAEGMATNAGMPLAMDAQGEIKSIRASQGKVKIKHGPIEKYGMPGMSMMFKVADPSFLEGLKKGQDISFNIDNSSGGFVITQIMATEKSPDVKQPETMDTQGIDTPPKVEIDQGTWFVQLMASRSLAQAKAFWQRSGQSLSALKGKSPRYEESEDYIRLLVSPGQSSQAARQLCQKLKQDGQDCFVRSIK